MQVERPPVYFLGFVWVFWLSSWRGKCLRFNLLAEAHGVMIIGCAPFVCLLTQHT